MKSTLVKSSAVAFALFLAADANAALVYHLPFSVGGNASLSNLGSLGGDGTAVTVASLTPTPSTDVPSAIGDSHSYSFPANTEANRRGGIVTLPGGNSTFRMNTTGAQMTISTWVKWNGPGNGTNTSYIVSNMNGSQTQGWSFGITGSGRLSFQTAPVGTLTTNASATVLTTGTWNHVALRYTAGAGGVEPTFYINGTLVPRVAGTGFFGALGTASTQTNRLSTIDGTFFPLNGLQDDFAMWDETLSQAKTRALYTTPTLINGYNAGMMNSLFTAFDSTTNVTIGSLNWNYTTGIDVTGRALGDTWQSGGTYYTWLSGTNNGMSAIPEPGTWAMMLSAGLLFFVLRGKTRRRSVA